MKDFELQEEDNVEIWEFAVKNDFVVVTQDVDFYELALMSGSKARLFGFGAAIPVLKMSSTYY